MAKRHRELLARLDPVGLTRHQITEKDVRTVEQYLSLIQAHLKGGSTWQDILDYGSYYGTSLLIHEVVEVRLLEQRGLHPLNRSTEELQALLQANLDAHIIGLYEEHLYLQEVINRLYQLNFEVATLMKVNATEWDLEEFLESELGVFILKSERVKEAEQVLDRLKGESL
jgi:hypothetical protein